MLQVKLDLKFRMWESRWAAILVSLNADSNLSIRDGHIKVGTQKKKKLLYAELTKVFVGVR